MSRYFPETYSRFGGYRKVELVTYDYATKSV